MADIVTPETRSRMMSAIRGKNTKPELVLRRALWARGLRYRVHDKTVPGRPDISHKGARLAVFVDGCFWHGCPRHYKRPETNQPFWDRKLEANRRRRDQVREALKEMGWRVMEIWECQLVETPRRFVSRVAREIAFGRER